MPEEPPSPPCPAARRAPIKLRYWFMGFVLLAVVGVWLANERSYARLQAYKQQLIAKGEKLGIADHIPKLPPASSNGAPDFLAAAERLTKTKVPFWNTHNNLPAPGRALVTWREGELPTGQSPDVWPEVLAQVEDNRQLLIEMSVALERPELFFPVDYPKGCDLTMPYLEPLKSASDTLASAIIADLHTEYFDRAFNNLLSLTRLAKLRTEPFQIAMTVTIRHCGRDALIATWEALQHPGWNDAQLSQLLIAWQSGDVGTAWLKTANLSRAIELEHFARCRRTPGWIAGGGVGSAYLTYAWDASLSVSEDLEHNWERFKFRSKLRAWQIAYSHDDELWYLQRQQVWLESARTAIRSDAFGQAHARACAAHRSLYAQHHPMMFVSQQCSGWSERQYGLLGNWETSRRIVTTAIALHRHRVRHGKFPESLTLLVPELLAEVPRDFMDGQPLRYKLQPDGQFLLWSVGEDFKDDGGDSSRPRRPAIWDASNWLDGRDWVWPLPATEAEVAAYHAALAARRSPPPDP